MACNPLNIQTGSFITSSNWLNAPSATFDGKTLTLSAAGLAVSQGANNRFHPVAAGRTLKYQILGTPQKYLLILDVETGPGANTRTVTLMDFTVPGWNEVLLYSVLASSTAIPLPTVFPSQGNGNAFLTDASNGTEVTNASIRRSDNGDVLCALGFTFIATGDTTDLAKYAK